MFPVNGLILIGGVLLLFAIVSSSVSSRIGVPVLVLFLAVGMLAGSEGIGGIEFENYALAHGIGTLVFFVVLVSALTQGWSLPALARKLRLEVPAEPEPPVTLEITSLRHVNGDIVEYSVGPESRAAGRLVRDLALPDGAVVAMVAREDEIIPPRGSTPILPDDHVFLVLRPEVRPLVDRVFGRDGGADGAEWVGLTTPDPDG